MRAPAALQSRSSATCSFISPGCPSSGSVLRAFLARHLDLRREIARCHRHLSSTSAKATSIGFVHHRRSAANCLSAVGVAIVLLLELAV